jgi:cobalamin synthase
LEDGSLDLVLVDSTRRAETLRAALAPLMVLLMIVVFAKLTLMALLLALLCASLACIYWIFLLNKNLAGFTGDGLGAAQQLTEVVFYLALVAVLNSTIPLNSLVAP